VLLASPILAGQEANVGRKLNGRQRLELRRLAAMVERVEANDQPGGDAWLKWSDHFLKASDGKTYIPFTLWIDEAPDAFDSVGVYIKVLTKPDPEADQTLTSDDLTSAGIGQNPVNVAERQFAGSGVPTAGEAAANLAMLESSLNINERQRPPFEDVHFVETSRVEGSDVKYVRRAMAVAPGIYDLYVSVREYLDERGAPEPGSAVLKQTLIVPDLAGDQLATSSIVLAESVQMLDAPLSPTQQLEQPYSLGNVQITPVSDTVFGTNEELSLVFLAYNMASVDGMPDVVVRYRFYLLGVEERLVSAGQPLTINAEALPPGFDLEAVGRQLPVTYSVPLRSFPVGPYRLEVQVTDNISDTVVNRNVTFIVEDQS
jgi:hypothetical protein